jgi:hypothetical protein
MDDQLAGRIADAIPLHEECLELKERILGPDHLVMFKARNDLAQARRAAAARIGPFPDAWGKPDPAVRLRSKLAPEHEHPPALPSAPTGPGSIATGFSPWHQTRTRNLTRGRFACDEFANPDAPLPLLAAAGALIQHDPPFSTLFLPDQDTPIVIRE